MDDQTVKSKKKVSFGKARVRLVFDYYNQESAQSEDTDEKTSRKIAKMKQPPPHPQKQPKSILKPSTTAVSIDSGLNALHRVPQRNLEKIDKNFWEPAKHKRNGRKRQASLSNRELENRDTNSESDLLKNDDKNVAKQENTNFSEGETNMASNEDDSAKDEPSTETPAVKNNEKWEGIRANYPHGLSTTSQTFVGIYSGVEADWDQTRQSLSRIGVDVGENKLQNPRDFVTIMNMLLSAQKEESDNQTVRGTEQDSIVVDRPAEMQDSNNNVRRVREEKTIPENPVVDLNEEDPVFREEVTSAKLGATHKSQKPAISKEEWKKRIKKLKMKGLIPRKKENSSRKERSYSEGNLNDLPITDCKVTNCEQHSSFDRFRSKMKMNSSNSSSNNSKLEQERRRGRKRSTSVGSLDSFSKLEVEKTGKRDDCSTVEDLSCDDEAECSSTSMDSSSTTHKDNSDAHFYSDNDLDLPRRVSLDGSLRRDRSFSAGPEGGSGRLGEDLKHKKERPKVVKRDSWFLTRKQQMKGESEERSNLKEGNVKEKGRKVTEGNDKGGGIDLEKQFKIRGTITQRTSCDNDSERRCGKITQKKSSVEEVSTSGSELENRNKSSKQKAESESSPKLDERSNPKDGQNRMKESGINSESQLKMTQRKTYSDQVKEDSTSGSELDNGNKILKAKDHKNEQTLLAISNQSGSEKEDSGLSTCASVETVSVPGNEQRSSNIVENTNKAEHLDVNDSVKQSEINRTIENQENFKITSKNEEHTKRKQTRSDSIDGNNSNEDECLVDKKFLNDLWFIDAETKRSLRSEEYLEKARKRYVHKRNSCLETNFALKVMEAISKNPAAGILLPFTN